MICKECESGHLWPYRGRGFKYDTGHWYRHNFREPGDYELTCKLTPWLTIQIYACPKALPWNETPHFIILLCSDQRTRVEMRGTDIDISAVKRKSLEVAKAACIKAGEIADAMMADIPNLGSRDEPPGLRRLRKAIAHAEALLNGKKKEIHE